MNKYSFRDLLSGEITIENQNTISFQKIEIPMIQRDYAQGRENESKVRERFLDAIFDALENGKSLEMDFVYGSVWESENKKENAFIPLDGQQRLTTLFLLYWYIGSRELELEPPEWRELSENLKKFTYKTRATSRKFCEKLAETKIPFDNKSKSPKQEITNLPWCFISYQKDPTVQSMLNMLDEIHEKYKSVDKPLFEKLENLQFYLLLMDGFGMSEELYIRMNARGKQLTDFENFKADLTKWMKNKEFFQDVIKPNGREMSYHMWFSEKMDTTWTDFFWNFVKDNKDKERVVDPYFMRFFNRYLCNLRIVNSEISAEKAEKDNLFSCFYGKKGKDSTIIYNSFENHATLLNKNEEALENIEKILDCLSKNYNALIKPHITPSWSRSDSKEKDTKKEVNLFGKSLTQRERVVFFAITIFIEKNIEYIEETNTYTEFKEKNFEKWMRFVWNIIVDPNLRTVPTMVRAIRFIKSLANQSPDIYCYLKDFPEPSKIYERQFEEECFKAKLIADSSKDWENEIIEAESHWLFKGNIRFLLTDNAKTSIENFQKNKEAAFEIFSMKNKSYLWVQALLAEAGEIDISKPLILSNDNDNLRRLINERRFVGAVRKIIKKVNKEETNILLRHLFLNTEALLKDICSRYKRNPEQNWVYPLVTWTGKNGKTLLGNYSVTRRVKKYGDHVYLFNQTRWSVNNILLSNFRNEIVAKLLSLGMELIERNCRIQKRFFKGWDIQLKKVLKKNGEEYPFELLFDRQYLKVGIKDSDDIKDRIAFEFRDDEKAKGWLCVKTYDYQKEVADEDKISQFIEKLNKEIFSETETDSLYYKIIHEL